MSTLNKRIKEIPGEDSWWKSSSYSCFSDIAKTLKEKGLSDDEIVDILESAYWAVADCYGG
jgi:hypothetical protein